MSVVIRGMKMPKSCDECDLNYDCFRCILPIENSLLCGKDTANGRLPNCPLIELPAQHGRLIDADVTNKILSLLKDLTSTEDYMGIGYNHGVVDSMTTIKNAPTIIEAEEVQNV